ncbi:hypothetical protein IWX48DRAFT_430363 [Phyllosticta citricarpa]
MAPRALHPSTSSPLAILLATVSVLAAVSEPTSLSSLEHGALLHYSTPILAAAAIVPCTRSALPPYCPLIVAAAAVASRAPHLRCQGLQAFAESLELEALHALLPGTRLETAAPRQAERQLRHRPQWLAQITRSRTTKLLLMPGMILFPDYRPSRLLRVSSLGGGEQKKEDEKDPNCAGGSRSWTRASVLFEATILVVLA